MKISKFIAATLLIVSVSAQAYERHDSIFRSLSMMKGANSAEVDFTGGWPTNGTRMGFAMMRGEGKGHTEGVKISVPNLDINRIDSLFDIFTSVTTWGQSDYYRTCYDEDQRIVYSLYYNEKTDSLHMIRASVEEETSLPYDWPFRTHYDASDSIQAMAEVPLKRTPVDFTEALVRLYDEVKYNFVFYPRIASLWDKAYKRNLVAMREAKDDYEKVRILQRMVALCGDGHTCIWVSDGGIEQPAVSPFTTVKLPDGLYVCTVESQELVDSGMRRGQKIVAINGEAPEVWAERELKPYVCSSTPQWTVHEMYDGYGLTRARRGATMDFTLENTDGSRFELKHKISEPRWTASLFTPEKFNFKVVDKNIGLLRIPSFQDSEVMKMFDSVFSEIGKTDALIIDLRGNGGGNSNYGDYIARHLIDKPIAKDIWTTREYRPAFASWGMEEEIYNSERDSLMPLSDKTPYLKPVVMLTDRGTFSAAEDFTALLKAAQRASQIGTATGGSTGNGVRVSLTGNGAIMANICSKHDMMPDGTEFVGVGLIPDIVVEESAASYFDPGRDDLLDTAIRYLKSEQSH